MAARNHRSKTSGSGKRTRRALATVGAVTAVVVMLGAVVAAEPPPVPQGKPGADLYGDPLPPGALARLGTIRWRHAAPITYVAFTPDGKAVLTASQDNVIRLWDRGTGKEIRRFADREAEKPIPAESKGPYQPTGALGRRGYGGGGRVVALAPDGKTLATAIPGRRIQLWELATGRATRNVDDAHGVPGGATALLFSPDGKTLAARGANQTIHLWDTATGKEIRRIPAEQKKARVAVFFGGNYTGSANLAFAPDGKTLCALESSIASGKVGSAFRFLEVATGKEIRQIPLKGRGGAGALAFSPDGKVFAYGDGVTVHLCAVKTGQETDLIQGQLGTITALVFAPDSTILAVKSLGAPPVRLYDVATAKEIRQLGAVGANRTSTVLVGAYFPASQDLAFSPDGSIIVTGGGNTLRFWETATGKEVPPGPGHATAVTFLALSADARRAVSRADGNTIHLWDTATGKQRHQFRVPLGTTGVALAPDGRAIALGNQDGTIRIHDAATGKELHRFTAHAKGVGGVRFSPDGKTLASRGGDNTIRLWDPDSGQERRQMVLKPPNDAGLDQRLVALRGVVYPADLGLVFSADGKTVAVPVRGLPRGLRPGMPVNSARVNAIDLWDVATGKQIRRIDLAAQVTLGTFALAPDSRTVATQNADLTITLWEAASGQERARLGRPSRWQVTTEPAMMRGGFGRIPAYAAAAGTAMAMAPDGRTLAATGPGQSVRLWDIITGKTIGELAGHGGRITALALARDCKTLISASSDTTALVWDVSPFHPPAPAGPVELTKGEVAALWTDLGGDDAAAAWAGINKLATAPGLAVALLRQHLHPTPAVAAGKIDRLIADLDSNKFRTRQEATDELAKLGELAVPALGKVLAGHPSLETRRRVEQLLEKATRLTLTPEEVRLVRAVEVLERLGTAEARQVLATLAGGAPGALPTREAQAALDRLGER
jgi:WD40 repeat protein